MSRDCLLSNQVLNNSAFPIVVFYKKNRLKIGFPMPTARNRFQILNLHPKKYLQNKIIYIFMPINQKNTSYFITNENEYKKHEISFLTKRLEKKIMSRMLHFSIKVINSTKFNFHPGKDGEYFLWKWNWNYSSKQSIQSNLF